MSKEKSYELARLHEPKSGTWLIFWYNVNPKTGQLERVRKTFNLNRIKDLKQRRAAAAGYIATINNALKSGWNFFVDEKPAEPEKLAPVLRRSLAAHLVGLGKESTRSYSSILNVFLKWADAENLADKPISDFTPTDWDRYRQARATFSPKNQNAHVVLMRSLFARVQKIYKLIKANPLADFELLPEPQTDRYAALTKEELQQVATHLQAVDFPFYVYCLFIFYAYVRPGHIGNLQRRQIDFEGDTIAIIGTETKGGRHATKQLLAPLKKALYQLKYEMLPPAHYLFGKDFLPSELKNHSLSGAAEKRWRKYVIKGLGIKKKMYALKHTSGQLFISENEGLDSSWLQAQMEHSSLKETETYISKRKAKKIDESRVKVPKF